MTSYRETLSHLYARAPRGIQPGLDRMQRALEILGHPERDLKVAHVAGTNGKGSVARMIAEGWGGGLFTSPHLHSLTERFRIDGEPVSTRTLVEVSREVEPKIADVPLTFFETVTVLAFEIFRRLEVERATLEVGLGGRLDSTNVVAKPEVTCITKIGLDHTALLGDDLASIAREKAGILKPGVPCVVGPQSPEADAVIDEVAAEVGATVLRPEVTLDPYEVREGDRRWPGPPPSLQGDHQRENAAVAITALWELGASEEDIARAIDVTWPGRLETVHGVLLDAAHNPDAARALGAHLRGGPPITLVFGVMEDKDHHEMLEVLRPFAARVVLTAPDMLRALDPTKLAGERDHVAADVLGALELARRFADPVVVTGSIFVVAEARAALLGLEADPPIGL